MRLLIIATAILVLPGCCCCFSPSEPPKRAKRTTPRTQVESAEIVIEPVVEEPEVQVYVDIPQLLGSTQDGAAEQLGSPSKCETVNPSGTDGGPKCNYRDGNIEVVFLNGRADWITIYGPGESRARETCFDAKFSSDSLELLGMEGRPTTTNIVGIFYEDTIPGTVEVTVFGSPGELRYVYVKGFTR